MRITLTLIDGNPIDINFDYVTHYQAVEDGTLIVFSTAKLATVQETFAEISEKLNHIKASHFRGAANL